MKNWLNRSLPDKATERRAIFKFEIGRVSLGLASPNVM